MADSISLCLNIQSILKHINSVTFDLRSFPSRDVSGDCVPNHSLSAPRLQVLLCTVSEKLQAWQGLWLKPKVDEKTLSIELWGRAATSQIRSILQGMFSMSEKIDHAVSILSQRAYPASKVETAWARLAGRSRRRALDDTHLRSRKARCECHGLKALVEELGTSADHLGSLAAIAFRVQCENILDTLPPRPGLETDLLVLGDKRRNIASLTQFCGSDDTHIDVDLLPEFRIRSTTHEWLQAAEPLLRTCYHLEGQSMTCINYDIYAIPALNAEQLPKSAISKIHVREQSTEGRRAFSGAASFVVPPASSTLDQSDRKSDTVLAEIIRSDSPQLGVPESERTTHMELPLLEARNPLSMRERLAAATGIAGHGLLFLGGVWGDCFNAMNLRRRSGSKTQARWFLHVHDPAAGLPYFERSRCAYIKSQILDIGLLLIGLALCRQVSFEGEDLLFFASRILPAVEKSMGARYKLACMFCLGVQRIELESATDGHIANMEVTTVDGHSILQLFYVHVCRR